MSGWDRVLSVLVVILTWEGMWWLVRRSERRSLFVRWHGGTETFGPESDMWCMRFYGLTFGLNFFGMCTQRHRKP